VANIFVNLEAYNLPPTQKNHGLHERQCRYPFSICQILECCWISS